MSISRGGMRELNLGNLKGVAIPQSSRIPPRYTLPEAKSDMSVLNPLQIGVVPGTSTCWIYSPVTFNCTTPPNSPDYQFQKMAPITMVGPVSTPPNSTVKVYPLKSAEEIN
jgi:hypothetical protein